MRRLALPLLLLVAWGVPLRAQTFVRGDADSNGIRQLTDPIHLLYYLFVGGRGPPPCKDAADADDNGKLEVTDAIVIIWWLHIGGRPPAPPTPSGGNYVAGDCGQDPSAEDPDLGCEVQSPLCSGI